MSTNAEDNGIRRRQGRVDKSLALHHSLTNLRNMMLQPLIASKDACIVLSVYQDSTDNGENKGEIRGNIRGNKGEIRGNKGK